ncbi:MAG: hypothetical protein GY804_15590 [Alphaproteobacteria bacterium]|nr:hypothetical protein [Alphaproteobacteria bacterium]
MNNLTFYTLVFIWSALSSILTLLYDLDRFNLTLLLVMPMSILISVPLQFIGFGMYWLIHKKLCVKSKVCNNTYLKIIFCGFLIAFFVGCSHVYMALQHNPSGEFCEDTKIKSGYTITINDELCTLNLSAIAQLWGVHFLICLVSALTAIPALFAYKKWAFKWIDKTFFDETIKKSSYD